MKRPAVLVLSNASLARAKEIAAAVDGDVHGPSLDLVPFIQALFIEGRPIIGIFSTAIMTRALAPVLKDKTNEPPIVIVSTDGSSVIPLLGAHHGANRMARIVSALTGGHAAISTASDLILGVTPDEPPDGYTLGNGEHYKGFAAALLNGEPVRITGDAPWLSVLPQSATARLEIVVTEKEVAGAPERLVYHPRTLALGLGCERGTDPQEMRALVYDTIGRHRLSWDSVGAVASIDLKEDEPAIHAIREDVQFFTVGELSVEASRLKTPSDVVMREVGVAGVAEAAALAAAGPGAELVVEKTKSARATMAIARAASPIVEERGRRRGELFVIGLGPGTSGLRAREATLALLAATDWVGYGLYLDLAADVRHEQVMHRFPLGEEEARVRHAIALAKQGKQVALISSGDPGIYAMAALVYEMLEREPARVAVEVIPGISAFQAASAEAGALIGHDFCCISLSDLLTPWAMIEKRVRAAAAGDFVVAFYNPRSEKRPDQLDRAVGILKEHRPENVPVVIASNLGRKDESVRVVPLGGFDSSAVDMLTIVLVGSSQSRSFVRGDGKTYAYTPRGYGGRK